MHHCVKSTYIHTYIHTHTTHTTHCARGKRKVSTDKTSMVNASHSRPVMPMGSLHTHTHTHSQRTVVA